MEEKYYVKICGITNLKDAELSVNLGADFLGFVFHPKSKRKCELTEAKKIFAQNSKVPKVLVFGFDDVNYILEIYQELSGIFTFLQIPAEHPEFFTLRQKLGIQKIFPTIFVHEPLEDEDLLAYEEHSIIILDTPPQKAGQTPGGTGTAFNWDYVLKVNRPFLLAGGLNPENICEAIRKVAPLGFDVASGLESSYGKKDEQKLKLFFEKIKKPSRYCL